MFCLRQLPILWVWNNRAFDKVCEIKDGANILMFPNLDAGNIAYKLLQQLGGGEVIGPFLIGVNKPAHVVQRTGIVDDIYNTAVLTALQAQAFMEGFNNKT